MFKKPKCFVICPIGQSGTSIRSRSDLVFENLLRPVAELHGHDVVRADRLAQPGMISIQVIQHVVEDHLVIADLTGANPNVFYELAIRHATGRPCLCVIERGHSIPFDVAAYRALEIDSTDLASLGSAVPHLSRQFEAALDPDRVDNSPVTAALGQWRFCVPVRCVPRKLIDSIVLSYLHLSFTMGPRKHLTEDLRCEEARLLLGRLEAQLHLLTDSLGMPAPSTFCELERTRWKAGRGEP